jgi:hypothetical protein
MKTQEKERKKMLKKFVDCKNRIWGNEANACNITFVVSKLDGRIRWYAECASTLERCRLTDSNYEEVLNDMFYDYCVENAEWMGVS